MEQDPAPYLALLRMPRLRPVVARRLLETCGSGGELLRMSAAELKTLGLPEAVAGELRDPDWAAVEQDRRWLEERGSHFISWEDRRYPALLREIPDPPLGLFVHGDPVCLGQLQVAVVGTRNPTASGRRLAQAFAAGLGRCGVTVVSGLALGVDGEAHTGALEADSPTVAVLGSGLDCVYPARHRSLAERVAATGALVSEFPPGTRPRAVNFPRRNRIISGLCAGVLVVEAARRSGSLITARLAMEQGREVFALPASVMNPMARGTHALIREGAKLTETVEDILEEIGVFAGQVTSRDKSHHIQKHNAEGLDPGGKLLLDNIGDAPVSMDELIDLTRIPVDEISGKLLDLELRGLVESVAGGAYVRRD